MTLTGAKEDVTEIVLNVKGIAVKTECTEPKTASDMMSIRNLGKKSFNEIESVLRGMGLDFKDDKER